MSASDDECDFINVPAETPLSPDEAIIRRHRREKRELQGKIQSMKKNVNKADKKKKKEVAEESARLEAELEARHKAELDAFRPGRLESSAVPPTVSEDNEPHPEEETKGVTQEKLPNASEDVDKKDSSIIGSAPGTPKLSKARRRREKKEAEDREKQRRIEAEASVLFQSSRMKAEDDVFEKILNELKLAIFDIEPDGNCLYNAVKDQLKRSGKATDVEKLRSQTAEYLRKHKDDFILFLDEEHSSTEEGFEKYCNELETTAAWGGQLEVRILSQVLERPIKVLQAEGPPIIFGEDFTADPLVLTYHRHKYQLGEHYNSATPCNS